jgi:hypothetical protein
MTTQTININSANINPADTKPVKGRSDALKLLLIAGLSVQAWGVLMGLSLIVLNIAR